jgi:hypothetical protein
MAGYFLSEKKITKRKKDREKREDEDEFLPKVSWSRRADGRASRVQLEIKSFKSFRSSGRSPCNRIALLAAPGGAEHRGQSSP